jgi:hypothetical protein
VPKQTCNSMTGLANIRIEVEDDPRAAIAEEIERRLLEALRQSILPGDGRPLAVLVRAEGEVIGGLIGSASYGWLLVKML